MADRAPCEAIILRYTNYGEADRIVTLLTREHGVVGAYARQARNSRRRFGGALQPFHRVRVTWQARQRGGLPQLAEVELLQSASALLADLQALALAAYGCELVAQLLPEQQPVPEVYHLLQAFLDQLPTSDDLTTSRLLLELRVLELAGLLPHLGHCAQCWAALAADDLLLFDARRGGTLCRRCAPDHHGVPVAAATLGSLVRLLKVDYRRFDGFRLSPVTREQGAAVVQQALETTLGRSLKSEPFLRRLSEGGEGVLP